MKYHFYIYALIFGFFISCSEKAPVKRSPVKKVNKIKTEKPLVSPPVASADISFQEITLDADSGKSFKADNGYGTYVDVPAGVFIDRAGKKVKGKINLKYREFHLPVDVFAAGIPLNYDAAGMLKRFNSAGMFELRAYSNGQEVYLDSGKVISVNLASFAGGNDYHAFYLDEKKTRNWHYLKDLKAAENPIKKKLMQKAKRRVETLELPLGKDYFAFNYMALLDVYLVDKAQEIKKLRNDLTIQDKIKDYGVSWSDIYCYESVELNGTKYLASLLIWKKLNPEPWPAWSKAAVCKISLKSGRVYELELSAPKGQSAKYKATIEAFMPIKSLMASTPAEWKYKYDQALRKAVQEEMRMNTAADVFRTIEVHNFGIYNCDKLMKEDLYVQVKADFKFDKEIGVKNDFAVYYMSMANRTVIKYPYNEWNNVTLLPDENAVLFAVMPGNYIAICDSEELKKLNYKKLKSPTHQRVMLEFKSHPEPVKGRDDIIKILGLQAKPI